MDYIDGRVVAAVVYRRRLHAVNLFVWPTHEQGLQAGPTARKQGYNLVEWRRDGLDFWAVSDISPADLQQFRRAFDRQGSSQAA